MSRHLGQLIKLTHGWGCEDLAILTARNSRRQLWKEPGVRMHLRVSPRARGWKWVAAAASAGVVVTALVAPGASAASTATPGTAGSLSAWEAVGLFASEVETLGVEQYPGAFAGATLEPSGVTDVYAVAGSDAGLVSAVQALNTQGYPVQVVAVNRSYSQLMAITGELDLAHSHLLAEGINLVGVRA